MNIMNSNLETWPDKKDENHQIHLKETTNFPQIIHIQSDLIAIIHLQNPRLQERRGETNLVHIDIWREMTIIPGQEMTISGQVMTIILGQQMTIIPGQQMTIIPSQQMTIIPSQQMTIIPGQEMTIIPSQQMTIIPGQEMTIIPDQEMTIIPDPEMTIIPDQEMVVIRRREGDTDQGHDLLCLILWEVPKWEMSPWNHNHLLPEKISRENLAQQG